MERGTKPEFGIQDIASVQAERGIWASQKLVRQVASLLLKWALISSRVQQASYGGDAPRSSGKAQNLKFVVKWPWLKQPCTMAP